MTKLALSPRSLAPMGAVSRSKLPKLLRFADQRGGKETEILVAAFHCIAEIGIAATTTRAVATRASMSQGAIHYYFDSKDALLLGVLKGLLINSVVNLRLIRESDLNPREKLECISNLSASFVREREEVIVRVALWAHCISKDGVWRAAYRALFDDFRTVIIEIIEEGTAKSVFKTSDSAGAAEIIISSIFGIGMQHTMDPTCFASGNIGDQLTGFYLRILGIEEQPVGRRRTSARVTPLRSKQRMRRDSDNRPG